MNPNSMYPNFVENPQNVQIHQQLTEPSPNYYAIIPAEVRYDPDLPANAKLLYSELTALCNKEGYCWASNDYFAKLYRVTNKSVSRWITALVENKYISSKLVYKDGTKEIKYREIRMLPLHRQVPKADDPYGQKSQYLETKIDFDLETKTSRGSDKKVQDNNTYNITSNSNTKKERKKNRGKKQTSYDEIINQEVADDRIKEEIYEFIKMRKLIKRPMTDKGLKLMLSKLKRYSHTPEEAVEILDQSIENSWQSVYPLKKEDRNYQSWQGNGRKGVTEEDVSDFEGL